MWLGHFEGCSQLRDPGEPFRPRCPSQWRPGSTLERVPFPANKSRQVPDFDAGTQPSERSSSPQRDFRKSSLRLVAVGYNHRAGITLYICGTNNGRLKTQPASFPPSPLRTGIILLEYKGATAGRGTEKRKLGRVVKYKLRKYLHL